MQPDLWTDVRTNDPETSHLAARTTNKAEGKRRVLEFLRANPGRAFADYEIANGTGLCGGSASKRRLDLYRDGLVVFAGEWGTTPSGSPTRKWRLA